MNNDNQVHEINLKYLLVYVLRHWRVILCTGLVVAVLFGAYSSIGALSNLEANRTAHENAKEIYQQEFSLYTLQKEHYEQQIEGLENEIKDQKDHLKNSILMNLDYKNVAQANASIFIKLGDAARYESTRDESGVVAYDPADSLMNLYYYKIYYNTDWKTIAQKYNTEPKYIEELINYDIQREANILKITVNHSEAAVAEEILDELIKVISDQALSLKVDAVEHTISIEKNKTKLINDTKLLAAQREIENSIIQTSDKITLTKAAKSKLIQPVLLVASPDSTLVKDAVFYSAIGFFLSVFVLAGAYAVIFCLSDKIHSEEEFSDMNNTRVLGRITGLNKKRFGNKIDRFIDSFIGIKSSMADEDKEKLLVYNVKDVVKSKKDILLVGNVSEKEFDSVKDIISNALGKVNITAVNNFIKNVDAYDKITENDILVAVEKIGHSKYSDIFDMENLIKTKDKKVSGYILV